MPDILMALDLVKVRLNRLNVDTRTEEYLKMRVEAAVEELKGNGITLTDSSDDLMLLVDFTVWKYQNRDKTGAMPDWLRLARRERFLRQQRGG